MRHTNYTHWNPQYRGIKIIGWIIFGLIMATIFGLAFGYFVMLVWNWIMPGIFGLTTITFWQAFGIVLLARLIFGGFKHGHDNDHRPPFAKHFPRRPSRHSNNCKDWRYYGEFWKEEGEEAFNEYVKKKKGDSQPEKNDE
ncbi:hypothetical protein ACFLTE_04700 [Bacteroidota bacterium]